MKGISEKSSIDYKYHKNIQSWELSTGKPFFGGLPIIMTMHYPNAAGSCINSFSTKVLLSEHQAMIIVFLHVASLACTLTANIMVVGSLIGAKQLESKINRMFFALGICDGTVAALVQPFIITMLLMKRDERFCELELAIQALSIFCTHCSVFFVVAVGIERLISIKAAQLPQNASNISYKRPYLLLFLCIFAAAAVSSSLTICSWIGLFYVANIILLVLDFFILVLVYSAYIEMYRSVSRHVKETAFLRKNKDPHAAYATEMAKAITLIVFFLFLSYIPYLTSGVVIFHVTFMQGSALNGTHAFITYLAYNFVYLNSFFNPVIVLYKNKKLLTYVIKKLRHTRQSFTPNSIIQNVDSYFKPVSIRDLQPHVLS